MRSVLFAAFCAALFSVSSAHAAPAPSAGAKPLSITRITPSGEDAEAARQLVFEFNRAVVPLGRMERKAEELPITITPALACQWRWINPSTLACQLGDDTALAPATAYEVKVGTAITAEDGAQLAKPITHRFITKRVDIDYQWFYRWLDASTPVIRVTFTHPVTAKVAAAHLHFAVEGKEDVASMVEADENSTPDLITKTGEEARRYWNVRAANPLPESASVRLVLKAGLTTPLGSEASKAARDVVVFDTFPAFALQGLTCTANDNSAITVLAANAAGSHSKCDPLATIALSFTTPVSRYQVAHAVEIRSRKTGARVPLSAWGELSNDGYDTGLPTSVHRAGQLYSVALPMLKADGEYTITVHPAPRGFWSKLRRTVAELIGAQANRGISDRFGQGLHQSASIAFATDHRRPNFELPNHEAVIERDTDSDVPFFVNNLDHADVAFTALSAAGRKEGNTHRITPPFVQDVQFAVPLGLRDMLGGKSGVAYGSISTQPEPRKSESERKLFAQVTPFSLHAKIGHFESVVWVTDFATGNPVEGVTVSLNQFTLASLSQGTRFASAKTNAQGVAVLPGYQAIDPRKTLMDEWRDSMPQLAVMAEKGEDLALLPLHYDFEVDIWRASNETIYPSLNNRHQHMRAWGTTAQGVYRTGQTIDYKLFVRAETGRTLSAPAKATYTLTLIDPMGNEVHHEKNLQLSRFGSFAGSYNVPEHAPMGWYRFELVATHPDMDKDDTVTLEPMRVLVSDFTPAPFKVSAELHGKQFHAGDAAGFSTQASLYSGGAYTDATARITAQLVPSTFSSKRFIGFSFSRSRDYGDESDNDNSLNTQTLSQTSEELGDKGMFEDSIDLPDDSVPYGRLVLESAVADERGKSIADEVSAPFYGRDSYVGIKSPEWIYEAKKPANLQVAVTNTEGEPLAGTAYTVTFEKQEVKAARVKSAGNAYNSQFITRWHKVSSCKGTSTTDAQTCSFTPQRSGYYRAIASIRDGKGRVHESSASLWVTGGDYVQWSDDANNALPIVPEKLSYNVGDEARFLIRNPYPGAQALITIERYGVVDHFVQVLEGSTPTISFPIKPDYLPGFYLSVVVTSPRVEKPVGKVGEVDLGKPTYRLGYVEVPVRDRFKDITLSATTEKPEYRPRDEITVQVNAALANPSSRPEPIELTAIVLDEAVFDLISEGKSYFDPYAGLYALSGLDLKNYSLLTRLIGRQKFEKKGANPGGDGGVDLSLRNLFKFVAYWNPALETDANGKASFSFTAPDNLTNWRIITLAATPSDRFGVGFADVRVNRPTEIRPVMPNQVREGDAFTAQFSVMNRTEHERTLDVTIEAKGALAADSKTKPRVSQRVTLKPYKREVVALPLTASALVTADDAAITFTATAADGEDGDATEHTLPVKRAVAFVTAASMASTDGEHIRTSLAFPTSMRSDVGSVNVTLSPSVIGNLEGAFRYMRDYPYSCWEQRLTQALMANSYTQLRAYLPQSFGWKEAETLPEAVLNDAARFQTPSGGMAYFVAEDTYADPYLSAFTAYGFNRLRAAGHSVPAEIETKLHAYLSRLLKKDALPDWYDSGMRSDVRALALAALAGTGEVSASDIARFAPHMPRMSLFGKAQFLQAALVLAPKHEAVQNTLDAIRAKGVESAGTLVFNETLDDSYSRILASPLRDNCAVLQAFLQHQATTGSDALADASMKMTRSITQARGNRDHFENTQENLFCTGALIEYAAQFERATPDMRITAALGKEPFGKASFAAKTDAPITLARAITQTDVGSTNNVTLNKEGTGRFYAISRITYAPTDGSANSQNAGIKLVREYSVQRAGEWELVKDSSALSPGDLVRVDLYASLPTARSFVVVDDPVPGALEPVNRDLATTSRLDSEAGDYEAAGGAYWFQFGEWNHFGLSRWSFYHRELGHSAVRFYADYLPAGNYHLSYSAQVVAKGRFAAPAARAEAMYDPDIFGSSSEAALTVSTPEKP